MTTYDVCCPGCDGRALAVMVADGVRGTYREPLWRMRAERITCTHCGLVRELSAEHGDDYRLWYRTTVGGEALWAVNRRQLDLLAGWLAGEVSDAELDLGDRARFETIPGRVLARRAEAAERLRALPD